MKKLFVFLILFFIPSIVYAQIPNAIVVSSCAALTLTPGVQTPIFIDSTGKLCTSAVASGSVSIEGIGTSTDAAATAGSTGTLSAKERLMTSQLDSVKTATEGALVRMNSTGVRIISSTGVAIEPVTNACDGQTATSKRYISAGATEDESEVKATAGTLCGISARNAHATSNAFIKCTNLTATNTTPGTSAVFYEMMIPAGAGYVDNKIGVDFSVALTCYIVLGKEDSAVDEVAANDVSYFLRYK